MNNTNMLHISGDVRFAGLTVNDQERVQIVVDKIQALMNEHGVTKIDVAINPWMQGPMRVEPSGPTIRLN